MVCAMRWARKGTASRKLLSYGLLFLGVPAIAEPPQKNVVQIAEEKLKKKDFRSGGPDT